MFNSTHIELSKSALSNNLQFIRQHLKEEVELSLVLKGNAYGHGISQMVEMAESLGAKHFSVYSADEALEVFSVAKHKPTILIMGFINRQSMLWAINNDVEFFVFDRARLEMAISCAKECAKQAKIHLELETGMYRTGFDFAALPDVIKLIKENSDHLNTVGCCTHFAGAESISNYVRIKKQQRAFKRYLSFLNKEGLEFKQVHTCCSAAAIRYPNMHYNMVRMGIMIYGFWPSDEIFVEFSNLTSNPGQDPLKRLITWKSEVMEIKLVPKGEFIGYGTSYLAHEDTLIALIPVGYGYGYARSLSNTGRVLINGMRAGVVGTVNMNCIAVNVTKIDSIKIGDEAVLIGGEGANEISVASFSRFSEQLNYELLTRIPQNIPRIIK